MCTTIHTVQSTSRRFGYASRRATGSASPGRSPQPETLNPLQPAGAVPLEHHPGDNLGANLKSISHRCHPILVAFVWELTKETIDLPLGCLQGGVRHY